VGSGINSVHLEDRLGDVEPDCRDRNSAHIHGTHVPVEEPSAASGTDLKVHACANGVYRAGCDGRNAFSLPVEKDRFHLSGKVSDSSPRGYVGADREGRQLNKPETVKSRRSAEAPHAPATSPFCRRLREGIGRQGGPSLSPDH
jgi:hypothetical protein